MYVVRLSCELPYAVRVRKNTAESITLRQRKQSKKADQIRRSFESLSLNILYAPNSSYSSLSMLPHRGQSSQLSVDTDNGNAQFLGNVL